MSFVLEVSDWQVGMEGVAEPQEGWKEDSKKDGSLKAVRKAWPVREPGVKGLRALR